MKSMLKLFVTLFRISPDFRGKWRLAAWLERNKGRFADFEPVVFNVRGRSLRCYPKSNFHLYMYGPKKNEKLVPLIYKHVGSGTVAIDVGAHSGYFTICLADAVGSSGRVYAFEASPTTHEELSETIHMNKLANVTAQNKAVSDTPGHIEFFLAPAWKSEVSSMRQGEGSKIKIEAISLDMAIPNDAPVSFVKIDVEGAEMKVLKGMEGIINRHRPVMAIEVTDPWLKQLGNSSSEVFEFLHRYGYDIYAIEEHNCIPVTQPPVKQIDALCIPKVPQE